MKRYYQSDIVKDLKDLAIKLIQVGYSSTPELLRNLARHVEPLQLAKDEGKKKKKKGLWYTCLDCCQSMEFATAEEYCAFINESGVCHDCEAKQEKKRKEKDSWYICEESGCWGDVQFANADGSYVCRDCVAKRKKKSEKEKSTKNKNHPKHLCLDCGWSSSLVSVADYCVTVDEDGICLNCVERREKEKESKLPSKWIISLSQRKLIKVLDQIRRTESEVKGLQGIIRMQEIMQKIEDPSELPPPV